MFRAALTGVTGVLRRPRATLSQVAAAPRWLALMAGLTVAATASNAAVMSTGVGQQALVDQWERTALAFGQPVDDARYAEFQALSEWGAVYGIAMAVAAVPLVLVVAAAVVTFVFGRGVPFGTVLAVVTHTGVILALRVMVSAPLTYVRETTASATSVGTWFPGLDEAAPLARLLGLVDVFAIWWIVALAIGVSVLYQRPATRVAMALTGAYVGLAAVLALAMAALGGA